VAAEAISVAMLALVLGFAVMRPWGWGEAVAAVPAAILVIAVGAISPHRALVEAERLGPIIGFLAAVLILAQLCQDEGLFRACGDWMARGAASTISATPAAFSSSSLTGAVSAADGSARSAGGATAGAANGTDAAEAPVVAPGDGERAIPISPTLLFRFSALTYNAHRIHYDRDFARDVEGYPGLLTHGPLQALAMTEAARAAEGGDRLGRGHRRGRARRGGDCQRAAGRTLRRPCIRVLQSAERDPDRARTHAIRRRCRTHLLDGY